MRRIASILLLIGGLAPPGAVAQQTTFFVAPQDTDAQIDAWTEAHYVALDPSAASRGQLFVWLPGTGGRPLHYRRIVEHAARLGYHAVGLRYPNDEAVNILCRGFDDLTCYGRTRKEIITGTDHTDLVAVSHPNSVENRLQKLLVYLRTMRPGEGWGQFLDGSDGVVWSRLAVSGHSQGGGHAAYIGHLHRVARVVIMAAADYDAALNAPADWYREPHASSPSAYFGFGHHSDLLVFRDRMFTTWKLLGMDTFGGIAEVDDASPPYAGSHQLLTRLDPRIGGLTGTHNSVAVDAYTPLDDDGAPILAPVWTYLLTVGATTTRTGDLPAPAVPHLDPPHPNPFRGTTRLRFTLPQAQAITLRVYDLLGREVATLWDGWRNAGTHETSFDTAGLPGGIYLAQLTAGPFRTTQQLLFIP